MVTLKHKSRADAKTTGKKKWKLRGKKKNNNTDTQINGTEMRAQG